MKTLQKIGMLSAVVMLAAVAGCSNNNDALNQPYQGRYQENNTAAQYNVQLGLAYLKESDYPRSKEKFLIALQQSPNSAVVLDAMAYYYEVTQDYKNAEAYYQKAISVASGRGAPLNNYGTFLCRRGEFQKADQYFLSATQDPQYIDSANAYENAGLCSKQIPDLAKAQQYFQKALAQDPNRINSLYGLADIAYQQQQYTNAAAYMNRLSTKQTNPDKDIAALGIKVAQKTNNNKMLQFYSKALRNDNAIAKDKTGIVS